jgi:GNAT superfamily N-acetyltransferase
VAPRDVYVRLDRSRVLRPVDDTPVWSISCLFVEKARRARGVSVALLDAAARFAGKQGARVVEGYPVVPYTDRMPAAFAWTGTLSAFLAAGFTEVARRSRTRPIVRRSVSA